MTRLMLHGRSSETILLNRLEQASKQNHHNHHRAVLVADDSEGGGELGGVSTLLMSGWNLDDRKATSEALLMRLYSFIFETPTLKEVILHNCEGRALQTLVAAILQSPTQSLMIRYDSQQPCLSQSIINGFLQSAAFELESPKRLRSLSFRGVTLSLDNVQALNVALREFPWLQTLSFKCNFVLVDLKENPNLSLLGDTSPFKSHNILMRKEELLKGECESPTMSTTTSTKEKSSIYNNNKRPPRQQNVIMKEFIQMISNLPLLESLELENCHLRDEDLAGLFHVLHNDTTAAPRINTLKLRGNRCQQQSMAALMHWLKKTPKTFNLTYLDLSWQIPPPSQSSSSFGIPPPPFQRKSSSSNNKNRKNSSNISSLEGFHFLAEGLAKNQSLETLILSENRLNSEYMSLLSRALSTNKSLKTLILKDCRITLTGLAMLARHLDKYHIQTLNMNGHQRFVSSSSSSSRDGYATSSPKIKDMLVRPLSRNVYLHDLILPDDYECSHYLSSSSIQYILEFNRAGRKVLLDPKFPNELWPDLLAHADREIRRDFQQPTYNNSIGGCDGSNNSPRATKHCASAIYYLLREKGADLFDDQNQ